MRIVSYGVFFMMLAAGTACNSTGTNPANTISSASPTTGAPVAGPSTTPAAPGSTIKANVDVCSLLTNADIKAVQGAEPTQAQRSDRAEGGYMIAQCYYALPVASNSVVLNVTARGEGSGAGNPRDFWKQTFASAATKAGEPEREKERERERDKAAKSQQAKPREREEEEEGAKPEKVAGLGEDAYWIAGRVGGALYVLKKDSFFRISVGGAGDVKTKLDKSKQLARQVLSRL